MGIYITGVREGTCAKVKLAGRFDFSSRLRFKAMRDELVAAGEVREIVLDFEGITHIDSAALAMLLLMREACDEGGKRVSFTNAKGRVRDILDVARVVEQAAA